MHPELHHPKNVRTRLPLLYSLSLLNHIRRSSFNGSAVPLPPSTPSPHDLRSSPVLYAASSPPSSIRASAPPPVLRANSSPPSSALAFSPPHVLLLPFPAAQGHVNPMVQFGRRLAYHGLRPTLVTTRHLLSTLPATTGPFRVAAISDGFDAGGIASCPDIREYTRRFAAVGSETPEGLFRSEAAAGRPVRVLVYDPHLPWARRVAHAAGVPTAAFFSQPCAVDVIYGEVWTGRVGPPVVDGSALRGLLSVELGSEDVPSFVKEPESYPAFLEVVVGQFEGLEDADDVFVNSFHELEQKEADYLASTWRFKTIGPMVPSFYMDDDRLPSNKTYGFNLFESSAPCMPWLDSQPPCSVVYASYGTVADLDPTQLEELGNGFCNSGKPFLWVVRSSDEHKLSEQLRGKCKERGLIVSWCPQLEVLSHKATGTRRTDGILSS